MPDLDAFHAGGATGTMSRVAQLAALQASSAAELAAALMRKQARPETARPAPVIFPTGKLPSPPPQLPPPPAGQQPPNFPGSPQQVLQLGDLWAVARAFGAQGQTETKASRPASTGQAQMREGAKPLPPLGGQPSRVMSKGIQLQNEEVAQRLRTTAGQLAADLNDDPKPNERSALAKDIISQFRKSIQTKLLGIDDLADNPLIAAANDAATWARYRRHTADYSAIKNKTKGDPDSPTGDGTFAGLMESVRVAGEAQADNLSASLNTGNLPPYVVARDEHGLLQLVTIDQWVNGKYADMISDPRYAAQVITALAMTSAYGTDATADAQRSRVALDKEGNPVKALTGEEDRKALAALATMAATAQNAGKEISVDDLLAQMSQLGRQITDVNTANGDYGTSGGRGRGGGGFGGGGGGAAQSIRLSDPTALASTLDSIGRQRMGRSLTPAEQQAFINHVHDLERQAAAAYYAGGEYTPIDMEGQAVDWIQNQYQREAATNQYGDLASQFIALMGSSNPFGAITS